MSMENVTGWARLAPFVSSEEVLEQALTMLREEASVDGSPLAQALAQVCAEPPRSVISVGVQVGYWPDELAQDIGKTIVSCLMQAWLSRAESVLERPF